MPMPRIFPVEEHVLSSYVLLFQSGSNSNNISKQPETILKVLDYENFQLIYPAIWSRSHSATSIFGTKESRLEDIHNIALSVSRIKMFIQYNPIKEKKASEGSIL